MTRPDIERAVARQFLTPDKIKHTVNLLEAMHVQAVEAKDHFEALSAGQLLTEVQKLQAKQQAPTKAKKGTTT